MHKRIGYLVMFLAFMLIAALLPNDSHSQKTREKEREKLQRTRQQLEQEIKYTNDLLEKARKGKKTSLEKVQLLTRQIRSREALIRTINRELGEVQVTIAADSLRIARLAGQLRDLKAGYARMIAQAYRLMNGNSRLMFIFSARDFNQAYQRLKYYQQYSAYRRQQVIKIEATRNAISRHKMELEGVRQEKVGLVVAKEGEKMRLNTEKEEKSKDVGEFTAKEKDLMARLKKKQQAAQKLNDEIEKLIAEEIRASEERARKAAGQKESKGGTPAKTGDRMEYTPKEKELSASFSSNQGRLPWPCEKGFISSGFGEHPHAVLEHVKVRNNGIDIMTEPGAPVRAIFNGRVSRVMSFPNLNKVVIIRHGEYLTVYSNLGEVTVWDGQDVTAKQNIGKVYTEPGGTRSELHFELWRGKVIQDPEAWLAGR